MAEFLVRGNISLKEIQSVLQLHFPLAIIQIDQLKNGYFNNLSKKCEALDSSLSSLLWVNCVDHILEFKDIPKINKECIVSAQQIGPYEIGKRLGEGRFATVHLCCNYQFPKRRLAVKIMAKSKLLNFREVRRVAQEINILKYLRSPYVTGFVDAIHTKSKLCLVTENGGPDLFEFLSSYPDGVPDKWAKDIILHLMRAVAHCHENKICHRDLKPENILVVFDPIAGACEQLKLCDFGLAERFEPDILLQEFCGSPRYVAPELILDQSYFGDKADIWSTGKVLLELVVGQEKGVQMWSDASRLEVLRDPESYRVAIHAALDRMAVDLPKSSELSQLVRAMVNITAAERPSLKSLCESPVFETKDVTPRKRRAVAGLDCHIGTEETESSMKFPRIDCKTFLKILVVDACLSSQNGYRTVLQAPYRVCDGALSVEESVELIQGGLSPRTVVEPSHYHHCCCDGSYDMVLVVHGEAVGIDGPTVSETLRSVGYTGLVVGVVDQAETETEARFLSAGGANHVVLREADPAALDTLLSETLDRSKV